MKEPLKCKLPELYSLFTFKKPTDFGLVVGIIGQSVLAALKKI
jgi:hypothetical protein